MIRWLPFAPAVAYLHLAVKLGGFAAGISIKEMPSLDKAMIQLFRHRYYVPNSTELSDDRSKFLHSVSNVTSLESPGRGLREQRGSPWLPGPRVASKRTVVITNG